MISLSAPHTQIRASIQLPSSKSESNRALIIQALSREPVVLENLSQARDTRTMIRLLESEGQVMDVIDAGTTMRFLTAYCAVSGRDQILTGTPRMCRRPIGILVDALRGLGAEIEYWNQEGYPPLHVVSKGSRMHGGALSMRGDVSSQFISAILMIAPCLPGGLELTLTGEIASRPYIETTRSLMAHFGVETRWEGDTLMVPESPYRANTLRIEPDWSAASYWYSMAALAESAEITLEGLRDASFQGDRRIAELMEPFGVRSEFRGDAVVLTRMPGPYPDSLEFDLTENPDLAQTLAVAAAATGVSLRMTGLQTLRIKETDRIAALQQELGKVGVQIEAADDSLTVGGQAQPTREIIATYEDHRMAMAFAPLVLRTGQLSIADPLVVEKSYPDFWRHLELAGIRTQRW
ncbi:MAG: 3-phosphoshikimate 1-carboxyvinyltransferase [Bacteroidia bacterium]|nr:3-phosphoshikimate 1-carboxyvinyltransferase [Bacteroidia bacterium]